SVEIEIILGKAFNVAFALVWEKAVRQSLSPPIEGYNCETSASELRHHFEVLLDEFGPTLKQNDCASRATRSRPPRVPQIDAVGLQYRTDNRACGDRVVR